MKASLIALSVLMVGEFSYALRVESSRCASDSLNQWSQGQALKGTARGRNEWLKICVPTQYDALFPLGNEFDEVVNPGRRLYPTFGIPRKTDPSKWDYGTWRAPTEPAISIDSAECKMPADYRYVGVCTSGCVTPDSLITTRQGNLDIGTMDMQLNPETLVPVQEESEALRLEPMAIKRYVKDNADANQDIVVVKTVSGGAVKVSLNHPLLKGDYTMAKAEDLKAGDSLVTADGRKDLIVSIEKQKYFGKLHNMTIQTNELNKSLYVVQGYISGDKKFQDIEANEINRQILREIAAETF